MAASCCAGRKANAALRHNRCARTPPARCSTPCSRWHSRKWPMTGSRRSATPPSTLASRCRAPASKPASAGPTCGRAMSVLRPILRWRSWSRSARATHCASSSLPHAMGARRDCSWRRTPAPAAVGRSVATEWCGSLPHAACWTTNRLPKRSGRRYRQRSRRTAMPCSMRRSASTAAKPRFWIGENRPTRTGRARTCASLPNPLRSPPTCCITRHCGWPNSWRASMAMHALRSTRSGPMHCARPSTGVSGMRAAANTSAISAAQRIRCATPRWICSASR